MNLAILNVNSAVITMSSLELVQFINNQRDVGAPELAHSDFLKKVPQVLGEVAGNFSCYYTASNGKQNPCYELPKREACLMAMSYSYDLQAKVFDRMTSLEEKQAAPAALSVMDILTLAMESEKGRLLALEQRDYAIATKAQIGDKKVATAMATASKYSRENTKLKALMGEATENASIIAVQNKTSGNYKWQSLKKYCQVAGLSMGKSYHPGLQMEVNTYPSDAWFEVYGVDLFDLFGGVTA